MAEEIVAVEMPGRGGPTLVDTDEAPRRDTTLERLASLAPLDHEHPTHTAGNSPGVNDGAAMLVVADAELARERAPRAAGAHPRHRLHGQPPRLARARARRWPRRSRSSAPA